MNATHTVYDASTGTVRGPRLLFTAVLILVLVKLE